MELEKEKDDGELKKLANDDCEDPDDDEDCDEDEVELAGIEVFFPNILPSLLFLKAA